VALAWRCEAIERWGRRQMDAAHLALERALEAAQRAPDEAALGQVLIVQAWLALESGSTEEVIRRAEHAMVLLDAAEAEYAYVTEAGNLSLFLMNLGMIEASRARALEGLVRCRRKRFRTLEAQFVRTLAATGLLLDAPDTDRLLEEASALSLEQSPGAQADLCIFQAWRERFTWRDAGEALERMRTAVMLRRKLAIPRMLSFALQDLAVLALDCGEVVLAGEALREGLALAQVGILPAQEALWVGLQGILAAHRGEAAEAERFIARQGELQVAIQHPRFRLGVELDAATVACLLGRGEAAEVEETLVRALRPEPPLWGLPGEPQPAWRLSRGMRASVRRLLAAAPVGVRERAWAAALDPSARGVVAVSADAWRLPGGEWVRLEGNPTLARVFNALVEARLRGDAGAVGVEALVSAGWPDEQILPDAAANRLHQAIARLRRQGLRGVLESCEGGYRVPREVAVLGCPVP
jgi:hypothetical protein